MKKELFAVAAVVLMAVVAQAGEIKFHEWPCAPVPQEITTIPVVMDVGFWIRIKDQNLLKITLKQDAIHTYSGCTNAVVETNSCLTFSCSISRVNQGGAAGCPGHLFLQRQPGEHRCPWRHPDRLRQGHRCRSEQGSRRHQERARRQRDGEGCPESLPVSRSRCSGRLGRGVRRFGAISCSVHRLMADPSNRARRRPGKETSRGGLKHGFGPPFSIACVAASCARAGLRVR